MDSKKLWIIIGVAGVLVPVIIVLSMYVFLWEENEPAKPVPVVMQNGGSIQPTNNQASLVELNDDGTSKGDALYKFTSKYGYSLEYNNKYKTEFNGKQNDFFICNDDESVIVVVNPMEKNVELQKIQTKEDWDGLMGSRMGECLNFKKTNFNGMDVVVSNYNISDDNGNVKDVLMAIFSGKEYDYSYIYTADINADDTEKKQIGAVLYTIGL